VTKTVEAFVSGAVRAEVTVLLLRAVYAHGRHSWDAGSCSRFDGCWMVFTAAGGSPDHLQRLRRTCPKRARDCLAHASGVGVYPFKRR
jgi:hypothetical protein